MTINPITNQAELNGQEVHTLRRLDEAVSRDGSAIIGTNYGDVTVKFDSHYKDFRASAMDNHNNFVVAVHIGTASGAFLKLADKLRGANNV